MGHAKMKIKSSIGVVWMRGFLGFKKWRKKKPLKSYDWKMIMMPIMMIMENGYALQKS